LSFFFPTWEWEDGVNRLQRILVTSPPGRFHHAMAYDSARQRVVMFDGSDTWLMLP